MPRRIQEDHKMFRDVVKGTTRRELRKYLKNGSIVRRRGKKGNISIPIPRIDLPHIIFGNPEEGVGRGPGKPGDVVGRDPGKGKGGDQAGIDPGHAIEVSVDLKDILKELADDWNLPNMLPKTNQTFEEIKIKYNSLSKVGPKSLLHRPKTLRQTLKRMAAMGSLDLEKNGVVLPGYARPMVPLTPIGDDMRYRQYNEIKVPSSNAVIFFARDISGSMGDFKCDIVSDMCWWIDMWIRQFYDKTERVYVAHDTRAWEVDEQKFYKLRMGGGTVCSSAVKWVAEQLKNRFDPVKWNIYVFYFSDGENWGSDNDLFCKTIKDELTPSINGKLNLFGLTQILPYGEGLKEHVDEKIKSGYFDQSFVRTTGIDRKERESDNRFGRWWWMDETMPEEDRNAAIKNAIKELLGAKSDKKAAAA